MNERPERGQRPDRKDPPSPGSRRQALDPFFVFTYALLALAVAIQFFLMLWMDLI